MLRTSVVSLALVSALIYSAGQSLGEEPQKIELQAEGIQFTISGDVLVTTEADGKAGEFYLGVFCRAAEAAQSEKLKVPAGQGLVIVQVLPGSPAAKAGLKAEDVLLTAGDKSLGKPEDLKRAIAGTEGNKLKLMYARGEQRDTIEVAPEKRGEADGVIVITENEERKPEAKPNPHRAEAEQRERLQRALNELRERVERREAGHERGGVIYHPQPGQPGSPMPGAMQPGIPDDLEVTIKKRGQQPARVTVQHGNKVWQTVENELEMLPPPIQGHVARLLGHHHHHAGASWMQMPAGRHAGRRFEFKLAPDGRRLQPAGGGEGANVRRLPGGGIEVRIGEEHAERQEQKPEPRPAEEQLHVLRERVGGALRGLQQQVQELQKQVEQLRREVSELREKK